MDQLIFVPTTGEFFVCSPAAPLSGQRPAVVLRLEAAGWPGPAQILRGGALEPPVQGTLVELVDALPILAALPEAGEGEPGEGELPPSLLLWSQAARLALQLVRRGSMTPRLRARRVRADDDRVAGWEGRWVARLPAEERPRLAHLAQSLLTAEVALPHRRWGGEAQAAPAHTYTAAGLLRRFLDLTADILVREATRRGAYVRIGGWPADAWEQRLVRALVDDRAGFFVPERDPALLAREVKLWGDDQAVSPTLLPSPPSWQAGESLQHVLERMVAPARFLADRMSTGEPAPRTLAPAVLTPRGRLSQAIAVTRTAAQRNQPQPKTGTQTGTKAAS